MDRDSVVSAEERLDSFDIYRTHYKRVHDHEVEVGIMIPKGLVPGIHPVFVRFHGGGCVSSGLSY